MNPDQQIVMFSRLTVNSVDDFLELHREALSAQASFNLNERVFRDESDPNVLTVQIEGRVNDVQAWLQSERRAELVDRLQLVGTPVTWRTVEIVD